MTGTEIREKFLAYFKGEGHEIIPSSSLVPTNDPTLLFTNAGMVQFKDTFTGRVQRPYSRASTCQKCMRAGGKHNDLENVGHTARHHTFFEMLGNFSFGDYFKKEAIKMAWELLTDIYHLPEEKLWITIFYEDEEAAEIWHKVIGIPNERIIKMGEKDNFWAMGDTGPCGPCSEIIIDQGPEFSCGSKACRVGCDCDRYLELWNLVFMQFDRQADGTLTPLPKPSIDTGMGLERITAVLQGKASNYGSDLFTPILEAIGGETSTPYGQSAKQDASFRVISDHLRAITFLLADGVLPSNEGRGYVLRRIIRRAARHGKLLNINRPFLFQLISRVAEVMQGTYPELMENLSYISKITNQEEERFQYALDRGLGQINEIIDNAKKRGIKEIPGEEIFRLYDTYGFPLDLTQDILKEQCLTFNLNEFEEAMEAQKEKARQHWQGSGETEIKEIYKGLSAEFPKTRFLGYETSTGEGKIIAIISGAERKKDTTGVTEAEIILDQTPFYGEKGGQTGDTGIIKGKNAVAEVVNTISINDIILHKIKMKRGILKEHEIVRTEVDEERRTGIALNHTATHLLHSALRNLLGDHVRQAGSLVAQERLRFDFTHPSPISKRDIARIEEMINDQIRGNTTVAKTEMAYQDAIDAGAIALFGEKYQERVRVIQIADFSTELCGGTHCNCTGQIGLFIILSETGVAAGVRRIEAITGQRAFQYVQGQRGKLAEIADILKTPESEIIKRIEGIIAQIKDMEKRVRQTKTEAAKQEIDSVLKNIREIKGIRLLTHNPKGQGLDMNALREMADMLLAKLGTGVIVLATEINGKANIIVKISKGLTNTLNAVDLIRKIAPYVGGSGGGRPDMAQAGGSNPGGIQKALDSVSEIIQGMP